MGFWHMIKLFSECYKLAGTVGLLACGKYVCGSLTLPDPDSICLNFSEGDIDG